MASVDSQFDPERRRLELRLDFPRGVRFRCPECERAGCEVHDTSEKSWRHLDFFEHEAYLSARVPRVRCPEHGVRQVELSWARQGSGFTLLFEALLMAMVREMPVRALADLVGEHDTRVWRVVHHYVDRARAEKDLSGIERVGVDETSNKRGRTTSLSSPTSTRAGRSSRPRAARPLSMSASSQTSRPTAGRPGGSRRSVRTCLSPT